MTADGSARAKALTPARSRVSQTMAAMAPLAPMDPAPLRTAHLLVALIVVGALALTTILVPNSIELGAHLLNDRDSGRARAFLESALAQHGPRRETLLPLAKIYGDSGQYDDVLGLLRQFDAIAGAAGKASDPYHDLANTLRLEALDASGRSFEYIRALEGERSVREDSAVLLRLADAYAAHGLVELQIEALEALLRHEHGDDRLGLDLAHLLAGQGAKRRALALVDAAWQRDPTQLGAADVRLLVALNIEADPSDAILHWSVENADAFPALGGQVGIARQLLAHGRAEQARRLLEPALAEASQSPAAAFGAEATIADRDAEVIEVWAQAMVALGRVQQAADRLEDRFASAGGGKTATLLCRVALMDGRHALAMQIARDAGYAQLDSDVLRWLASTADELGERASVIEMLTVLRERGGEDKGDLLAVARLYWRVGDLARARTLARAALRQLLRTHAAAPPASAAAIAARADANADPDPDPDTDAARVTAGADRARAVAALLVELRDRTGASEALAYWHATAGSDIEFDVTAATLYWRAGALGQGQRALARRKTANPVARQLFAALFAAAGGAAEQALGQLSQDVTASGLRGALGADEARALLAGIESVANEQGQHQLALRAIGLQLALAPHERRLRVDLARHRHALGEHQAALDALAKLSTPLTAAERDLQRTVLLAAHRATGRHRDALIAAAVAHVASQPLDGEEAQSWVHLLVELEAWQDALPWVSRLAETVGGAWRDQQLYVLDKLGDVASLKALWRRRGDDPTRSEAERLRAAVQLRALGDRDGAVALFWQLAERAEPDSDAVLQLLYLWGPRPPAKAIAWLQGRAEAASGDARVQWARHLHQVGQHAAVLALLGDDPASPDALALRIDTLIETGDDKALARLTLRSAARLDDAALLSRLGERCAAAGEAAAALHAFERSLALRPNNPRALRYLASRATATPARASAYWRAYFGLPTELRGPESWRDRAAYAAALAASGAPAEAVRDEHGRALAGLDASQADALEKLREGGRLLARMGRQREAASRLLRALAQQPCDDPLRADLVAALMADGKLEEARAVVDPPARCGGGARPTPGGER